MLDINRENIANDLRNLGLHQKKSFTIKFPNVPEDMLRHFIRGCWDGDGGFKLHNGIATAYYTSGPKCFVEKIAECLFQSGVYRKVLVKPKILSGKAWLECLNELKLNYPDGKYPAKVHKRKNQNVYDLRIALPESLYNLFHYFYDNVDETMYMERKFKKSLELLNNLNINITNKNMNKKCRNPRENINKDFYENGLSIKEIARKHKLSINNIKNYLIGYKYKS